MWVGWAATPHHLGRAATSFSAAGRPVQPLLFCFDHPEVLAHDGGHRKRRIAARMARTMAPVIATSAS